MRHDPSLTRTRFAFPCEPAADPGGRGWALALIGLAVVMLACGGAVL